MNWSDVIDLVGLVEGIDDYGFPTKVKTIRKGIFANKKSIRSNEYYQAKQSGINLAFTFEIRSIEYQGEEELIYDNNEFIIERTYEKGEFVELVCKRKADDHAT